MAQYMIQVSNHPQAGARIPTAEAESSWETRYIGPIATPGEARATVDRLSIWFAHVRAFKGTRIGRLWYAVLRGKAVRA